MKKKLFLILIMFYALPVHADHKQAQTTVDQNTLTLNAFQGVPYALCAPALCTIDVNNPHKASCTCEVFSKFHGVKDWRSISIGPRTYKANMPTYKNNKLTTVVSNFSRADFSTFDSAMKAQGQICESSTPLAFANCLGVRCKVVYKQQNGKETPVALCNCPVQYTHALGHDDARGRNCNPGKNLVWSGATRENGKTLVETIKKQYNKIEKN